MSSIGIIINDKSNRSASVLDDLVHLAGSTHKFRTDVLEGIEGLGTSLAGMNQANVDTLILAGGDGTIQAAFTEIIRNKHFEHQPNYVVLPCGMTNVIANDCGLKGDPVKALDQFLWRHQNGNAKALQRNLIGVSSATMAPIYGFFLGAAGFHTGVEFSRSSIQSKGAKRSVALIASVMTILGKLAFDRDNTIDEVEMEFLEGGAIDAPSKAMQALFLTTTLKNLGSGIFPFWAKDQGAMTSMTVSHPAKRVMRAAPHVLRGKSRPWFKDHGLYSWRADQMVCQFTGPFVFDGEIFQAEKKYPVTFNAGYKADFLS